LGETQITRISFYEGGDVMKISLAVTLSSLLILFGLTSASFAEQSEPFDPYDGLLTFHPFSENIEKENGNEERVYIAILPEDRFGNDYGNYVGSRGAGEKWNYSGGNIFEVLIKKGRAKWSFLPARQGQGE